MSGYNSRGFVVVSAVAVLLALSARLALATDHVIQLACNGHYLWNPTTSNYCADTFQKWAQNQKFYVGDTIAFFFDPDDSNVAEVDEDDYNNCKVTGIMPADIPISLVKNSPANFTIEARPYYFISTVGSTCSSELTLSFTPSSDPPPPPPPFTSIPSAVSSPSIPPSHHRGSIVGPVVGLAVILVLISYLVHRYCWMPKSHDVDHDLDSPMNDPGSLIVNNHIVMQVQENHMHPGTP